MGQQQTKGNERQTLSRHQVTALLVMGSRQRATGWSSADLLEAGPWQGAVTSRGLGMTLKGLFQRGLVACCQRGTSAQNRSTRYTLTASGQRAAAALRAVVKGGNGQ